MCTMYGTPKTIRVKAKYRRPLFSVLLRAIVANRLLSTDDVCLCGGGGIRVDRFRHLSFRRRAFYRKFQV